MVAGAIFSHFLLFFLIFEHKIFFIASDNEVSSHEKIYEV